MFDVLSKIIRHLVYVFETALAPSLRRGLVSSTSPEGALFVWDQCLLVTFSEALPIMVVVLLIALRLEILKCQSAEEVSHVLATAGAYYSDSQLQRVMEESGIESSLQKQHGVRRPAGLEWTPEFRHDDSALYSVLEKVGYQVDPTSLTSTTSPAVSASRDPGIHAELTAEDTTTGSTDSSKLSREQENVKNVNNTTNSNESVKELLPLKESVDSTIYGARKTSKMSVSNILFR